MKASVAVATTLTALVAMACGSGTTDNETSQPVPLPRVWPRTAVYPEVYIPAAPGSDLEVVEGLTTTQRTTPDGYRWVDISYPAYHATLYLSDMELSSDENTAAARSNRMERMALNSGGRQSEKTEFLTPAGYDALILTTPTGSLTPVQFVATGKRRIVSGAFTLDRVPASADSLAPTLRAVERDIIHLVTHLR